MKQYLFLLICLFVFYGANSQDIIVTNQGDTIDCKITRITDGYIHFSVIDKSGILLMRSRIPLAQVQRYDQADIKVEDESPDRGEIKEEDRFVLDEFEPASLRLSLNAGYTYQFGGYEGAPDSYKKQVQSLWNLGGEFHYFLSERIGIGAKYNHIFTKAADDFDPLIYGISTIRDERIRFSYGALSLMFRNFQSDDEVIQYFISGGIIKYKTDGLIDGNAFYEEGDTFGFALGVTYDFLLTKNLGIGAGAEVNIARLSEINTNGGVQPADFSLTRIDLTIGLRLYK